MKNLRLERERMLENGETAYAYELVELILGK